MIYQILLFKKFPWFLGIALFLSSAAFVWIRFSQTPAPWLWMFVIVLFLWIILLGDHNLRRCTLFEAALPIHARDLYCSRAVTILTLLWVFLLIPALAFLTSISIANRRFATLLFEDGGVMTLVYIALHSLRPEELSPPRWWRWTIFAIAWGLFIVSIILTFALSPLQMFCVVGICGLGSVVLFLKTWTSFPQSFQLAQKEPVKEDIRRGTLSLPTMAWKPALSGICNLHTVAWILLPMAWGAMANLFFVSIFTIVGWARMRMHLLSHNRWLFSLPISRHRLFAMTTLVPLAAIPLSSLLQLHFSSQSVMVIILDGAAVAVACLLVVSLSHVSNFFPQVGPWQKVFLNIAAFLAGLGMVWPWFNPLSHARRFSTAPIERWFASIRHARLPLVTIAAAAILLALYGLAYLGFRQMEIPPKRTTATR